LSMVAIDMQKYKHDKLKWSINVLGDTKRAAPTTYSEAHGL